MAVSPEHLELGGISLWVIGLSHYSQITITNQIISDRRSLSSKYSQNSLTLAVRQVPLMLTQSTMEDPEADSHRKYKT
jgi:hypothetical protein